MSPSPKSPPLLGLTMGDPQGIGPEILVRAVAGWKGKPFIPVALGDAGVLGEAAKRFTKGLEIVPIDFSELPSKPVRKKLCCISLSDIPFSEIKKGELGKKFGKEVHDYLLAGINLALEKKISALVTAPLAKSAFAAAGIPAKGHTEILAERSGVSRRHAMMLAGPKLRVTLATVHIPLRQVPEVLTKEKIVLAATLTHEWLKKYFGVKKPKIAVAGLNPHAGEAGLLGSEEQDIVGPALEDLREKKIPVEGPLSPDAVFHLAYEGRYDAVIALYHDQGLAPFKLVHFDDGVNLTLGLPFVRTSPDHGTAFDIAWKGKASTESFESAIRLALDLSSRSLRK